MPCRWDGRISAAAAGRRAGAAQHVTAGAGEVVVTGPLERRQIRAQRRHRFAPTVGDGGLQREQPQQPPPPVLPGQGPVGCGEQRLCVAVPAGTSGSDRVGVLQCATVDREQHRGRATHPVTGHDTTIIDDGTKQRPQAPRRSGKAGAVRAERRHAAVQVFARALQVVREQAR